MEKDLVSIVVPVYNSEKYLEECIESIVNQTYSNLEIIFVDDGSTDSSVDIINRYKESDNRIQLIKQKNQYAGVARNNGMKIATGKYIIFLDSDDYFELNMIEKLHSAAIKHNAELVVCNYNYIEYNNYVKRENICNKKNVKIIHNYNDKANIFQHNISAPWNKFILKSLIDENDLEFQNLKSCNDVSFTKVLSCLINRTVVISDKLINYRIHNESLQHNNNRTNILESKNNDIKAVINVYDELKKRNLFNGRIRNDYYDWLDDYVKYIINDGVKTIYFDEIFNCLKKELIPYVFENIKTLNKETLMFRLYNSSNAYSFLYDEYIRINDSLKRDYIPISSTSYKLGNFILTIPKWIYKIIKDN